MSNTKDNRGGYRLKEAATEGQKSLIRLAAINQTVQHTLPTPTEEWNSSKQFIRWGDDNLYPYYLLDLYRGVTTLRSIVDGAVKYTVGDEVSVDRFGGKMNRTGETARDLVRKMAFDYWLFGGYALQVIRSNDNKIAELYHLPMQYLRTDKEGEVFYYSEQWEKGGRQKATQYPKFVPKFSEDKSSVYMFKESHISAYPEPHYLAAVRACEIERSIDEYHHNSIENGFLGSYIFQFNNGRPNDEQMAEIERMVREKYSGSANAGNIMLVFNDDKETGMTVERIEQPDFAERYNSLASHCRQQIFSAFHANPNLFGIPTENLGFNNEEYEASFKLFNRTMIQPVQDAIVDSFDYIFSKRVKVTIKPFSIDRTDTNTIVE